MCLIILIINTELLKNIDLCLDLYAFLYIFVYCKLKVA